MLIKFYTSQDHEMLPFKRTGNCLCGIEIVSQTCIFTHGILHALSVDTTPNQLPFWDG